MRVYLAGKMTNEPQWGFPEFHAAAADLRARGIEVVSPAEHDEEMGFDCTDPNATMAWDRVQAITWDLKQVSEVDAVVVLPNWVASGGAAIETRLCWWLDKPVLAYPDLTPIAPPDRFRPDGERIVTSSTGGKKGRKLAELGGLDPRSLLEVAEVSGYGAQKYGDPYNYLLGYDWSLSFNAMMRHMLAFWSGEEIDPESGLKHAAHACWHALALLAFSRRGLGTDDRFTQEG